jgi:hypothetical protein
MRRAFCSFGFALFLKRGTLFHHQGKNTQAAADEITSGASVLQTTADDPAHSAPEMQRVSKDRKICYISRIWQMI